MPRAPGRPPGIPGIPPGIPGGAPPGNERGSTGCLLGPGYMLPASSLLTTLHLHPVTQRSLLPWQVPLSSPGRLLSPQFFALP